MSEVGDGEGSKGVKGDDIDLFLILKLLCVLLRVVSTFPFGNPVRVCTPVLHPKAGEEGHTARLVSSSATTVITKVAYTSVSSPILTSHSLHASHIIIAGW